MLNMCSSNKISLLLKNCIKNEDNYYYGHDDDDDKQ